MIKHLGIFTAICVPLAMMFSAHAEKVELVITDLTPPVANPTAETGELIKLINSQNPNDSNLKAVAGHDQTNTDMLANITNINLAINFVNACNSRNGYAYIGVERYIWGSPSYYYLECTTPKAVSTEKKDLKFWPHEIFTTECSQMRDNLSTGDLDNYQQRIVQNIYSGYTLFAQNANSYYTSPCVMLLPNKEQYDIVQSTQSLTTDEMTTELAAMKQKCEKYHKGNTRGVFIVDDVMDILPGSYKNMYQHAYCVYVDISKNAANRDKLINESKYAYRAKLNKYIPAITAALGGNDNWSYAPDLIEGSVRCRDTFTQRKKCNTPRMGETDEYVVTAWFQSDDNCEKKKEFEHLNYNGQDFPTGSMGFYTACEFSVNVTKYNKK